MPAFSPRFAEKFSEQHDLGFGEDVRARSALSTHNRFIFRGAGRTTRKGTNPALAGTRVQGGIRGGDFNPTGGPLTGKSPF